MNRKLKTLITAVILLTGFFSANAQEKEADLPTLIHHARELRDILAADPYRPKYHFVPPEGFWNDVNGMIYWKGRYHLFYLSRTVDPELNRRLEKIKGQRPVMETWGHSSSIDLVHWIHHPFALVPAYDGSMPREYIVAI